MNTKGNDEENSFGRPNDEMQVLFNIQWDFQAKHIGKLCAAKNKFFNETRGTSSRCMDGGESLVRHALLVLLRQV